MVLRADPFRDLITPLAMLGTISRPASMPVDVYRKDDAYLVQVDLPGVISDSIDVTVQRNVITLSANPARGDDSEFEVLLNERPVGTMTRSIVLGEEIDASNVQADYSDGVLKLFLPVAEAARPRRVVIRRASEHELSM
jgi:HSP20 family protein